VINLTKGKKMPDLLKKLQRKLGFSGTATLLYFDELFNEYILLPQKIKQLPITAKLLIKEDQTVKKKN